ncbi:cation-transporting P-type ATPase, partial [Candidatus Peregrinibacteria bacterium]|nr:cation-transporting P-type ATPase [Candidatus Peregrinibacteria bacterium]
FAINFALKYGSGESIRQTVELSLLFAISVAAACVPQGLPAQVSVALSLGVGRLARKNAVVKKLSAVETLGSTTVICSDKTGTITKNEMTITHAWARGRIFEITGEGYDPEGAILENGKPFNLQTSESLKAFFEDGFLSSNGRVNPPDKEHAGWYAIGDPTEAAFTPFALKAGLDPAGLDRRFPVKAQLPFDSARKRMTVIRGHGEKTIAYMKGSLESVLAICTQINLKGEPEALSEETRRKIMEKGNEFAGQALRVIALAYRDFKETPPDFSVEATEKEFVFAGFVAMIDPPRIAVKEAVQNAYNAHIRVMMITGDNAVTAQAIARRIGLQAENGEITVFTGDEIKAMADQDLRQILMARSIIFSRVSPQDKFRLVTLLKRMGEVVAVTGDGVNDTLSLKRSDIGVAMGKMGSEVAKEASEIILLDDNFGTLTSAIREGRTVFNNLKKTILSTITSNNGELFCVLLGFVGMMFGLPAPITAVQILAIDLIGEMLPLTALTFDRAEAGLMDIPPRDLKQHIINRKSLASLLFYGFWMGTAGFFSFVMVHHFGGMSKEAGRAAAYMSIILCQFMNILSRRTERTLFTRYFFTNPQLWGSFLFSAIAVSILIYAPWINVWFGFAPVPLRFLWYPALGVLVFLFWHELKKMFFSAG